jgi:Uma2 family endonuclease
VIATKLLTAEDLEAMGEDARYELVRGELRPMSPIQDPHGRLLFRVGTPLDLHLERTGLGYVTGGEIGIILERNPDTVLAADLAVVLDGRRTLAETEQGYLTRLPALVIEIASPSDSRKDLRDKAKQYLDAGIENVWLVEYRTRSVSWIGVDREERVYKVGDVLDGGDLIPGFRLAIADIIR